MSKLLKQRADVYENMKAIMSLETRSDSELAKFEDLEKQYSTLTKQIEAEARFEIMGKNLEQALDKSVIKSSDAKDEIRSAFTTFLRSGDVSELRNINSYTAAEGGVNVPTIVYGAIGQAIQESNVFRRIGANVLTTTSTTTLPLAGTAPTAQWKAENPSGSYSETPQGFSSATLNAYKLTALVKISEELLQDASTDVLGLVQNNIGVSFGNGEEQAFASGSGVGQPLGLFRVTSAGGNNAISQNLGSATGSVIDSLVDGFYAMPQKFRNEAVWVVGDGLAANMRKQKATTGAYLWEVSAQAGQPDLFLGRPVYTCAYAPASWTVGQVGGILVNPKQVTIGDRGATVITRLNELYAAEGNVAFRGMKRVDLALHDGKALVKFAMNVA